MGEIISSLSDEQEEQLKKLKHRFVLEIILGLGVAAISFLLGIASMVFLGLLGAFVFTPIHAARKYFKITNESNQ